MTRESPQWMLRSAMKYDPSTFSRVNPTYALSNWEQISEGKTEKLFKKQVMTAGSGMKRASNIFGIAFLKYFQYLNFFEF